MTTFKATTEGTEKLRLRTMLNGANPKLAEHTAATLNKHSTRRLRWATLGYAREAAGPRFFGLNVAPRSLP